MKRSCLRLIGGDALASAHRPEVLPIAITAVLEVPPPPSEAVTTAEIVSAGENAPPGRPPETVPPLFDVQPTRAKVTRMRMPRGTSNGRSSVRAPRFRGITPAAPTPRRGNLGAAP